MITEKLKQLLQKYREVLQYLIFGILTTAVSLLVYCACTAGFLDPQIPLQLQCANVISWVCAVTFAYITNRRYVFESRNTSIRKEAASFFLSRLTTLLLDMFLMFLLVTMIQMNDQAAKLIVQVLVIVLNYVLSKLFVFKNRT